MKSLLRILVPLVILVVVVFGITYFSRYTPTDDDGGGKTGTDGGVSGEPPLRFFTSGRRWDPRSESLPDRIFPGFYEPGETQHKTAFWFENRNDAEIQIVLKGVSCSACSGSELASLPPDTTRLLLQMTAVSALPQGLVSGLPVGMAAPAAAIEDSRLTWKSYTFFDLPEAAAAKFEVPAAVKGDGWTPQWGILRLTFKVRPDPKIPLTATFVTKVKDRPVAQEESFAIWFEPANAFEVAPPGIEIGELTASTPSRTFDFMVYSSTRGVGRDELLPPPATRIQVPNGGAVDAAGYVSVGTAVPLKPDELDRLAFELSSAARKPVRVETAYRLPVIVNPQAGTAPPDIGLFERDVWLALPNAKERPIRIKGTVRGAVWLSDGTAIDLGSFKGKTGTAINYELTTERTGIELALVENECKPDRDKVKIALEKLPDRGERGYYKVRVTVEPGQVYGAIIDGVVVLEVKGPTPQRIRIPLKGRGDF